jgi:hypothetical protein
MEEAVATKLRLLATNSLRAVDGRRRRAALNLVLVSKIHKNKPNDQAVHKISVFNVGLHRGV